MSIKIHSKAYHIVFVALLVTACGGGGGDDGGSNNNAGGGGGGGVGSSITQANAIVYASEILYMGDLLGIGDIVEFAVSVETEEKHKHGRFNLTEFVDWSIDTLVNMPYDITPTSIVSVFPDPKTEDCGGPTDGTVSIVWNDNGDSVLSNGDSAVITFSGCKGVLFGDDALTGTVDVDVTSALGDWVSLLPPLSIAADITITDLQLVWDTGNETDDAALTINAEKTAGGGSSLTITGSLDGVGTDDGFDYTYGYDNLSLVRTSNDTGDYSVLVQGDVFDSDLGDYTVNTSSSFDGNENDVPDNPQTGNAIVAAPDASSVTINVLDNVDIELQVDSDGNSINESTFNVTWEQLNSV